MTPATWSLLVALALALAADAFAVALCQGATARAGMRGAVRIGVAFGAAQALMPLFGWAVGVAFAAAIRDVDHWIAFVLLGLLGARTVREGLSTAPAGGEPAQSLAVTSLAGWALLGAAMATSIDAAAAGVTLPTLGAPVLVACAVIGVVTLALCTGGVLLGAAGGARLGKRAEVLGGVALILIGTKILIEHLFFGG